MMTAAERMLWQRVQRRAQYQTPGLNAALQRAYARIRDRLSDADIIRAIETGRVDQLISDAILDAAMDKVREELFSGVKRGAQAFLPDLLAALPAAARTAARAASIGFGYLNPRVIDAIRALDTRVTRRLGTEAREVLRLAVEQGLRAGHNPRTIAKDLRDVIGLAPRQLQEVENFRAALRSEGGRNPLSYAARDMRFDAAIRRGALTDEQIERMVAAYRKRRIAQNAATNAHTAALGAQKLGQRLSWEDAIAKGIIDRGRLQKTWIGVMDARERPEHRAMEDVTVGFDEFFVLPDGAEEQIPGETTYNCRCIARYAVA